MLFKVGGALVAGVVALLVVNSADAFFCYNASRSANGNAHAAKSQALVSVDEFLTGEVGLCPAGVEHVVTGLEDAGFETDFLINGNTIMAGGLEKNGKGGELLHNGKGIDHLSDEFFATADGLIGEGFGLCNGG
jgi:hypothetical protein